MKDNIRPEHYRKGEIDLYEAFSKIFPHNEYRAGMQMIAMRYMFRDKTDRVEDISKAIYSLERLKEKEIEYASKAVVRTLKELSTDGYKYIARDSKKSWSVGGISAYVGKPHKDNGVWIDLYDFASTELLDEEFPEIQWTDDEPTKIANLLASYENGGENGK